MTHDTQRSAIWIEDELDKRIGARLAAIRENRGLSIPLLAAATGIPARSLHDHESGMQAITAGRLLVLCQTLETKPSVLFEHLPDLSALDPWTDREIE